ncbi:MAG: phosphoglycerate dehydrogenase [Gammaproteobacteria bacterium]|nr:phosphoglycerate dehydrogenase [Gammaproteobacteria bacterium]
MPKVLISTSSFSNRDTQALTDLRASGIQVVANPHGRRLSEDEIAELLRDDVVGLLAGVEPLTRRVLQGAKNLRVISRCGIGLDNVDLTAAKELGITVLNTPDAPSAAVAELTLGTILALLRKIPAADQQLRAGIWKPLMGRLLAARTVGIVGYGRIGRRVASLLKPFGCRLLVTDMIPQISDQTVEWVDLDTLIASADVITLHVPCEEGKYLIDADRIAKMRSDAVVVNLSRGGLVDEAALLAALQSGRLAGAAIDTFEREPYAGPLAALPQVVLTAHMGSYAEECRNIMECEAADNLLRGLVACGLTTQPN